MNLHKQQRGPGTFSLSIATPRQVTSIASRHVCMEEAITPTHTPFPNLKSYTGGWRASRRTKNMSSASIAAAAGDLADIPSTNDDNTSSTTSPPRIRSDQAPSSTTPRRRQRQQQTTKGLIRPAKLSGRQSRRQNDKETEGKGIMGNGADTLLGEAEVEALEEDESRCVGILFLAHDGVTNPSLWEKWRDSDPVSRGLGEGYLLRLLCL